MFHVKYKITITSKAHTYGKQNNAALRIGLSEITRGWTGVNIPLCARTSIISTYSQTKREHLSEEHGTSGRSKTVSNIFRNFKGHA